MSCAECSQRSIKWDNNCQATEKGVYEKGSTSAKKIGPAAGTDIYSGRARLARKVMITKDEECWLLHLDADRGIAIFSTDWQLRILKKEKYWICDGTFKVSPKIANQLYSIHCKVRNAWFPVVLALTTRKKLRDVWMYSMYWGKRCEKNLGNHLNQITYLPITR